MTRCLPEGEEEKYDFFKHADKYIKHEKSAEESYNTADSNTFCDNMARGFSVDTDKLTSICKIFKRLIQFLYTDSLEGASRNNEHDDYLSYWLSFKLKEIDETDACAKTFYQSMVATDLEFKSTYHSKIKIRNIGEDEFSKIKALYVMYKKYNEINNLIDNKGSMENNCMELSNECVKQYKEVEKNCPKINDNFCKALTEFEGKYKELSKKSTASSKCDNKPLPPLKESDITSPVTRTELDGQPQKVLDSRVESSEEPEGGSIDMQSIIIPVFSILGICLIKFILFKFTSFGSWISFPNKKKKHICNNLNGENDHLLDISEYEQNIADNISYHISYKTA
ncbi:PIR Superfamily Protein [Plasmodium ovale wallikeri]|uniref:Plasmodium vivax Vir protein/Plasmodium variant antigen protein Cir/Yir/Bir, putative n=2 Tax=Plasmodium ovale TaxID=36330 RepID=A0A1C3KJA8_PLAOA|nr:PIR Superfamily Protein [Plasmodium ovale wallikeri]SBT73951.1 Plasmodium vivax Vir protein/Plasmodium variant antigen protein Cir/Yir/Bir, putative [Plasmodium ovale]